MSEVFGAASHDEVLQLVIQVGVLLAVARAMGIAAQRMGQSSVIGEILAGIVLGPSLLSGWVPAIGEWVLPQTAVQGHLLEVVSLIGVMLLMVVTGLETDLVLIRQRMGVASGIAIGGLVVPFASGLALAFVIPTDLLADPQRRPLFAMFLATALALSAIPVLAKVLMDMGLMRQAIGQTMLAAGMVDDILGWTMLGLVTGLAGATTIGVSALVGSVASVIVFVVVTATVGRWLMGRALDLVQDRIRGDHTVLSLIVVLAFAWGAFSQALHLEPVLGAFAVGILFGALPRVPSSVIHTIEAAALGVFAPIFFATAGLKVDVGAVLQPDLLVVTIAVILVATFGKVAGAYLGGRYLSGQSHWSSLAYGAGLNARGALGIIVASIGLSVGILSGAMFSVIVVMSVVTSLMAPIGLRVALRRIEPNPEEERRLAKQEAVNRTFTAGVLRMLIPVRPRTNVVGTQVIQATLARRLAETHSTSTTLLAVAQNTSKEAAMTYLRSLRAFFDQDATTLRVATAGNPADVIRKEAAHGYGLLMVGVPTMADEDGRLFGPLIDDVIRFAPCPSIVVKGDTVDDTWEPRRIVVPVNGTANSNRALDLAFAISSVDAAIVAVHVSVPTRTGAMPGLAVDVTDQVRTLATDLDRTVATRVVEAMDVETGVLEEALAQDADLIVLGTGARTGTARLHLGPRVETIARHAHCPVVIING